MHQFEKKMMEFEVSWEVAKVPCSRSDHNNKKQYVRFSTTISNFVVNNQQTPTLLSIISKL